jgi:hypothetical protein
LDKKERKAAIKTYLKSRRGPLLRMGFFFLLAFVFYRIGKAWKESFYVTLRFFYPICLLAAFFQMLSLLPHWSFLKPRIRKLFQKAAHRLSPFFQKVGKAFKKWSSRFSGFGRSKNRRGRQPGKGRKSKYRDEVLYAEGKGFLGRRRHHLRWRDMESNADKVRFYYMRYVLGLVKKGAPFGYHLTPAELKALWKHPEGAGELVRLYYRARYSQKPVSETELALLEQAAAGSGKKQTEEETPLKKGSV